MKTTDRPLYFDNHATTAVDPAVVEAMLPYFTEHYGNPESALHPYGWKARTAVEAARTQVAAMLGAEADEIVFTAGTTESINLATLGLLEGVGIPVQHIITAATEHHATLEVCARAKALGHEVTILPVDRFGRVAARTVTDAIRENTTLVTLMHANNEIGTLHPIGEIGQALVSRATKDAKIAFHVDAAQTAGKHPIDVRKMHIDLLSLSAHKFHGPKGVGALFVRRTKTPPGRPTLRPQLHGGGQERGLRGGTHNVPGIVGLGRACEIAQAEMAVESARLMKLRDRIIEAVGSKLTDVMLNGHPTERLVNNVNITVKGASGDTLLFEMQDIAYSSASACAAGAVSHVLKAIGSDAANDPLSTTMRFGLGRFTTGQDVETLINHLVAAVHRARST